MGGRPGRCPLPRPLRSAKESTVTRGGTEKAGRGTPRWKAGGEGDPERALSTALHAQGKLQRLDTSTVMNERREGFLSLHLARRLLLEYSSPRRCPRVKNSVKRLERLQKSPRGDSRAEEIPCSRGAELHQPGLSHTEKQLSCNREVLGERQGTGALSSGRGRTKTTGWKLEPDKPKLEGREAFQPEKAIHHGHKLLRRAIKSPLHILTAKPAFPRRKPRCLEFGQKNPTAPSPAAPSQHRCAPRGAVPPPPRGSAEDGSR